MPSLKIGRGAVFGRTHLRAIAPDEPETRGTRASDDVRPANSLAGRQWETLCRTPFVFRTPVPPTAAHRVEELPRGSILLPTVYTGSAPPVGFGCFQPLVHSLRI